MDEEYAVIESYLRFGEYPNNMEKGEKANLRRKCRNNFKFDSGILYYKKAKEKDSWTVCVRTEEEKKRILQSCHAGMEGIANLKAILYTKKYTT